MNNLNPYEIITRHQVEPPVDVKAIAENLGIGVWEGSLPNNISGKLIPDAINGGSARFSIIVNGSEGFTRKRFTIAHEIAHFILHRRQIEAGIIDNALYRSGLSNVQEYQANKLAADILMPRHLVSRVWSQNRNHDLEVIANFFMVSPAAMKIRINQLGLK
jgi:Zn-dependent peptidase ImmA (M78 family)